jgi:hypothetical protein
MNDHAETSTNAAASQDAWTVTSKVDAVTLSSHNIRYDFSKRSDGTWQVEASGTQLVGTPEAMYDILGSFNTDPALDAPLNELFQIMERTLRYKNVTTAYTEQKIRPLDKEEQANLRKKAEALERAHIMSRWGEAPKVQIKQLAMAMLIAEPDYAWTDEEELASLMDEASKENRGGQQEFIPGCSSM